MQVRHASPMTIPRQAFQTAVCFKNDIIQIVKKMLTWLMTSDKTCLLVDSLHVYTPNYANCFTASQQVV